MNMAFAAASTTRRYATDSLMWKAVTVAATKAKNIGDVRLIDGKLGAV
jgi:hypothetical protein